MHICIVYHKTIPVVKYGGIQRIVWWLGKELVRQGHQVTYLVGAGSHCPFAEVLFYDPNRGLNEQIPESADVVHLYVSPNEPLLKPYLIHMESNTRQAEHDINTVFVSRQHAARHGSSCFVYNGLDPEDYTKPSLSTKKDYLHFLGKAAWRVKNVRGAIKIAQQSNHRLHVLGGTRLNFHMGFRFTPDPRIRFHGMIGGAKKDALLNGSKGLLFPVVWHEPFGIAITESMFYGCPVFATPYGSLPELVDQASGFLSDRQSELVRVLREPPEFDAQKIHERMMDCFSVGPMVVSFLGLYEKILNGQTLNEKKPTYPTDGPVPLPFYD